MIYIEKKELPRICLDKQTHELPFIALRDCLKNHFSDIIYVEYQDKLYGLISLGDIIRGKNSGHTSVTINRKYSYVKRDEYIPARTIFKDHSNIHALPIIDETGRLIGAFSRFDDLLYLKYWDGWEHSRFTARYLAQHRDLALVKPVNQTAERLKQYKHWCEVLSSYGCHCDRISWKQVPDAYDRHDIVLFTDEDERRGAQAMLLMQNSYYDNDHTMTFRDLTRAMSEPPAEALFQDLKDRGIHVLMLYIDGKDTPYQRGLNAAFERRKRRAKDAQVRVCPEEAKAFYGEHYTKEYAEKVGMHMFLMEKQNSFTRLKDSDDPYFHISNGERLTVGQPEKAAFSIYFFGPCIAVGPYVEDAHTIESLLQLQLNQEQYPYRVVNCGCWENPYSELTRIMSTPMKKGDIAVIFYNGKTFPGFDGINLSEVLEAHDAPAEWMLDQIFHCNDRVNLIYAKEIYKKLRDKALIQAADKAKEAIIGNNHRLSPSQQAVNFLYLDRYFWNLSPAKGCKTGNISMHANPFTLGHQYLIDYARKHSDRLIVLLIEEEMGIFSFAERYAMTCEALKGLNDVIIAPAGPFQATRAIFPEYFVKTDCSLDESAANDLRVFATLIAPPLGINCRFFGDERHNPKMQRFNALSKRVLNEYGIEAVEIPRLRYNSHVISASMVRKMGEDQYELLGEYVPQSTLSIMKGVSL